MEAKAQLQSYPDYFDERDNREALREKVGMSIFRPRLSVVIGRSAEFQDEVIARVCKTEMPTSRSLPTMTS